MHKNSTQPGSKFSRSRIVPWQIGSRKQLFQHVTNSGWSPERILLMICTTIRTLDRIVRNLYLLLAVFFDGNPGWRV